MTNREGRGLLRRLLTALGGALKRAGPSVRDTARPPPETEYEPVHGWTRRQRDAYLARNPGYRATYEAELAKRCG
jgi:hypothetical protein